MAKLIENFHRLFFFTDLREKQFIEVLRSNFLLILDFTTFWQFDRLMKWKTIIKKTINKKNSQYKVMINS